MNSPIFSELLPPKRRLTIMCLAPLPQNRHQQSLGPMMSRLEIVTNSWEMAMVRKSVTALKSHSALKMSLKLFDSCPSWCLGLGEFMEPLFFLFVCGPVVYLRYSQQREVGLQLGRFPKLHNFAATNKGKNGWIIFGLHSFFEAQNSYSRPQLKLQGSFRWILLTDWPLLNFLKIGNLDR